MARNFAQNFSNWICLGLAGLSLLAGQANIRATDQTQPAPPPAGRPGETEANQKPFSDPFATESDPARAAVKTSDPLEPMNRAFFKFNDQFYFHVLKPAARGYNKVAPQPVRAGVQRFFNNVKFPIRFVNNLLETRLKGAGVEAARFLLNSTAGMGGLLDPARSEAGLEPRKADFDQTLACYGFKPGAYLVWPFLGPCSVRGTVGLAGDTALTPWTYIDYLPVNLGVPPYEILNGASLRLGEYEDFKKSAFDPYVALRSAYLENRLGATKSDTSPASGGKAGP